MTSNSGVERLKKEKTMDVSRRIGQRVIEEHNDQHIREEFMNITKGLSKYSRNLNNRIILEMVVVYT